MRSILMVVALLSASSLEARAGWGTPPDSLDFSSFITASVRPASPCVADSITLHVEFCDPCGSITATEVVSDHHVRIFATTRVPGDSGGTVPCSERPCPMNQLNFALGTFPAGANVIDVELVEAVFRGGITPAYDIVVTHEFVTVDVRPTCGPLPGPFPYVDDIRVGAPALCGMGKPPICAGSPIGVFMRGTFPNSCWRVKRVDYIEPMCLASIRPCAAIVRILLDPTNCTRQACEEVMVPWSASVAIPALPSGDYSLTVEYAVVACSDVFPNDSTVKYTSIPFQVVDCAVAPPVCLIPAWVRNPSGCDAVIEPGHEATLDLGVQSWAPLAGLQGNILLHDPSRLAVSRLQTIGAATGMHLQWTRTSTGARFVMFADRGAPIPAAPPDFVTFAGQPVLRVGLAVSDSGRSDMLTIIEATDFLGSDSTGGGVPTCGPPPCVRWRAIAQLCPHDEASCDVNNDGWTDVRDLVGMVHCVLGTGYCPDPLGAFDCNHDGRTTIDDVLCCAGPVLRGHMPDSAATRDEPGVRVRFGDAIAAGDGVDLPVRIEGDQLVGAARLALDFPADRFVEAGVAVSGGRSDWLTLSQIEGGQLIVGLVNLMSAHDAMQDYSSLNLVIHFKLAPGQSPGGDAELAGAEFSGPDGAALRVNAGSPWQTLGGQLGLSPPRPNPFGSQTRFTLDLTRAARVEMVVHDVAGRRVTTLFRGDLPAGIRAFEWNGRDDRGNTVHDGIYFVRCVTDGRAQFQRVVLLRN